MKWSSENIARREREAQRLRVEIRGNIVIAILGLLVLVLALSCSAETIPGPAETIPPDDETTPATCDTFLVAFDGGPDGPELWRFIDCPDTTFWERLR